MSGQAHPGPSGHQWPSTDPLPPGYDDPDVLQRHIADMIDCPTCYPDGTDTFRRAELPLCSRHRDPVLLANGYVHG